MAQLGNSGLVEFFGFGAIGDIDPIIAQGQRQIGGAAEPAMGSAVVKGPRDAVKALGMFALPTELGNAVIRDSAANLGINCFIQNTKKLKQPSLMLLNTRYEALAAKFECVDTFEF